MLAINNLSFYFGSRALYEDVSLHIKERDKIGLIGANGTGKSTLLKLIAGTYQPDGGSISKSKDCTIGFLNQDLLSYQSTQPIVEVAMEAFEEQNKLMNEINDLLRKMETEYSDDLVNKLASRQEKFEALDGYSIQSKTEEILEGLGFKTEDLQKPLEQFSGGWRMRVMLAKMLLGKPALLLLDEPTNHLDLPSIEWLENYVKTYEGAVVIVSHDREFLDRCISITAEVSLQSINVYSGNYSFYLKEKQLRSEIHHNAFVNQQKQIKDAEKFINRFKAKATKARQVQSRVKALEKLDVLEDVVDENAVIHFNFNFTKPSGKVVLKLEDLSKNYGPLDILKKTSSTIMRGDKIALIGANGKGKSTLLRIINGTEPIEGLREEGYNVEQSFFAQHQLESLTLDNGILDELKQSGVEKTEQELRAVLGCFLFQDEDVFKKIKILSGGEKSRVALAKTLISEANFLLLDEPTNHLDMQSVNMLIQALQQYAGSFVVVSHDRHFVSQVANKIWYIEDLEIKEYPGTYEEYKYWESTRTPKTTITEKAPKKEKPKQPASPDELKQVEKDLKSAKKKLEQLETDISELESEISEIENAMASPEVYANVEALGEKTAALEKVKSTLEEKNEAWEGIAIEVDALEEQRNTLL